MLALTKLDIAIPKGGEGGGGRGGVCFICKVKGGIVSILK
jgi:hypothetical protein